MISSFYLFICINSYSCSICGAFQISFCIFFLHHLHLENPFHSTFRHWNSNCKPMAIQIQIQNHSHSVLNPQRSKLLIMPKLKEDWIITTHNFRSHIEVDGGIHKYETHLHLIKKKTLCIFVTHNIISQLREKSDTTN